MEWEGEKIETKSLEYAESIIDTVREPLMVLDQELSGGFCQPFILWRLQGEA